jgi:deoxyribonuclease-4
MRRLGFHISIAGGFSEVVPRALARGCTAFQMFTSSPSQWARRAIDPDAALEFRRAVQEARIEPVLVHAVYLLNLASPDPRLQKKSVANLADELRRAEMLGAAGVIFHLGSVGAGGDKAAGVGRLARSLVETRRRSRCGLPLILENSAGAGSLVGGTLEEVSEVMERAKAAEPMKLCFDTAHAFGAGIPIHTKDGLKTVFSHPLLQNRLAVVHANDSAGEFASRRDRHWHVGRGRIGMEAFRQVVNHPLVRGVPLIMETPGTESDDRRNMRTMKRLLAAGRP